MKSKRPIPPDKAYYKLESGVWRRCFSSEGDLVVCTGKSKFFACRQFMYAIDLKTKERISDITRIASEIHIDLCLDRPLPAMRTLTLEQEKPTYFSQLDNETK